MPKTWFNPGARIKLYSSKTALIRDDDNQRLNAQVIVSYSRIVLVLSKDWTRDE